MGLANAEANLAKTHSECMTLAADHWGTLCRVAGAIALMDELTAKVTADGEKADKAYKEHFEWCDDTSQNLGFEIKTAKAAKEKFESSISKLTSDIEVAISKIWLAQLQRMKRNSRVRPD